jgi:hypothetical protein
MNHSEIAAFLKSSVRTFREFTVEKLQTLVDGSQVKSFEADEFVLHHRRNEALDRGVICALRHIHMTPDDALRYGVRDKSIIKVRLTGDRELEFGDILVRMGPNFALAMHIDTDEANAANVKTGAQG